LNKKLTEFTGEAVTGHNTLFQMTSLEANEIAEGNIMPSFKIQGQVYHLTGSLLLEIGNNAKFLQITKLKFTKFIMYFMSVYILYI
jgi:hypothetical protein